MKKLLKVVVVAVATAVLGGLAAVPVGASPPTGYGFDGSPEVVVGGGSDTTYFAMTGITDLYNRAGVSAGCVANTTVGPDLGKCVLTGSPEVNDLGNWQHDTVGEASPTGSSAGIASLNGFIPSGQANTSYAGTVNPVPGYLGSSATGPNVDFARSSRGPKTSGGNVIGGGNELSVDTFWGYAEDGIQIIVFNARTGQLQGAPSPSLTATDLFHIFNCDYTSWNQVPNLGIAPGSATDGPIVPWGMNSSSGTFATFQTYIQNNASGVPAGWSPNGQACDRKLSAAHGGIYPFENDMKPLINDPAALSSSATSTDNPVNWITWGSFGDLSAFSYKSKVVRDAVTYQAGAAPVNGIIPSSSNVLANTYPIGRTLYHVTRKQDADCAKTAGVCDFNGNPGPQISAGNNDLNVTGGTSGVGGAVRELTRWLCRSSATKQKVDPFSGVNYFNEITSAIGSSGFTVVPSALRAAGSRCQVLS